MFWQNLLLSYFKDPLLDEVLINSKDQALLLESRVRRVQPSPFSCSTEMIKACQNLAFAQGLRLDPLVPAAGGTLTVDIDGQSQDFRWHCLLPPLSRDGPLLSLRRHRLLTLALSDFLATPDIPLLEGFIQAPGPVFIAGPTGAGKTSLLMALLGLVACEQRVAILEQLAELPRLQKGWIRLTAQGADLDGLGALSLSQGFDELLRLRPDRIVIGELRQKAEVQAIRRAVLAGHGSVWSTLHAASASSLAARLADMAEEEESVWQKLLHEQEACLVILGRDFPRVKSLWQFSQEGVRCLFADAKKRPG